MTNQLTYPDLDTTTIAPAVPPVRVIPPTHDEQPKRPSSGRRWMLMLGGAALAATAVVGFAVAGTDSSNRVEPTEVQRPAYLIIQDEIDKGLAERNAATDLTVQRPAYLIIQDEIDRALAERNGVLEEQRSTAQIVQDEIDQALAGAEAAATDESQRPAYLIIQDEIDKSLAERQAAWADAAGG